VAEAIRLFDRSRRWDGFHNVVGMTTSQLATLHSGLIGFAATWPVVVLLQFVVHRSRRAILTGGVVTFYASTVIAVTLLPLPGPHTHRPSQTIQLLPFQWVLDFIGGDPKAFTQVLLNIALFVPLGFLARKLSLRGVVGVGFTLSLLIEITQLTANFGTAPFVYRIFDVDDLLTNTTGTALGWILVHAITRVTASVRVLPLPKDHLVGGW
jgi:glycopeptide antibiotics resistance protein